jgi:hypothetical protein
MQDLQIDGIRMDSVENVANWDFIRDFKNEARDQFKKRYPVDQNPCAFPSAGDALAPTLARGKTRHRRRHTPNESCLFLRLRPESALAWLPMCRPSASAAASDALHSSTPIASHVGHHTTGIR